MEEVRDKGDYVPSRRLRRLGPNQWERPLGPWRLVLGQWSRTVEHFWGDFGPNGVFHGGSWTTAKFGPVVR